MRLLLLLLVLLPLFLAEDVQFTVYYKGLSTVTEVGEKVKKLVGMVNSDNQFLTASIVKIDCTEEENGELELCKDVGGSPIVEVKGGKDTVIEVHGVVNHEDTKIFKQVQRIFIRFCTDLFISRADGGQREGWWEDLPAELSKKISKYSLSSPKETEDFKQKASGEQSLLVCFKSKGFEDLAAVFSAIQAAEETKALVVLVSCEVTRSPCCNEEKNLPRIHYMLGDKLYQSYDGELEPKKVADFIRMLQGPVITELSEEIVPAFRSGKLPDFPSRRETTMMFFSPNRTSEPFRLFEKFSRENHGKYHFGTMVDKGVAMWPRHPALIIGKPYERVSKVLFHTEDLTEEGIRRYIEEGARPSIHYVEDMRTAEAIFAIGRPVLFFFDKTKKTDATAFAKLAADDKLRRTLATFAVINGRNMASLFVADQLKVAENQATFVLYRPDKGCVHVQEVGKQSEKELEQWLKRKLKEDCDEKAVPIHMQLIRATSLWERKQALLKLIHASPSPSYHDEL